MLLLLLQVMLRPGAWFAPTAQPNSLCLLLLAIVDATTPAVAAAVAAALHVAASGALRQVLW
jgi:hypothetical protein